jgi:Icc protein
VAAKVLTDVRWLIVLAAVWLITPAASGQDPQTGSFHFAILGDHTGEAQPGVYEQVWREVAAENPAFVISVGDTIQGGEDTSADSEWRQVEQILGMYRRYPLYLAPGNHDIWSAHSEGAFRKYAGHAPHYSFDYGPAHFTILDNSRSEQFSAEEFAFLEADLETHKAQPVKFIVSHRPSWLFDVLFKNSKFTLHQLAKKYGVRYVIAGHLHEELHGDLDGVSYLSVGSSGGHLRGSEKYEDGWFFGHTRVDVRGQEVVFRIEELKSPHGQGRITSPNDWDIAKLAQKGLARDAAGAFK